MLATYLTQTAQLLQNPAAPASLYSSSDLTGWINTARGQLAIESECIRSLGSMTTTSGTKSYAFSTIGIGTSSITGIQGIINVRMLALAYSGGVAQLSPRSWEEFFSFFICQSPVLSNAQPTDWAQFQQGVSGNIYFSPTPDATYTVTADAVGYPIPLVDDTTVESIPYPWTDAVPYFAAYLALLAAQSSARSADADRMMQRYHEFADRARQFSNPSVERYLYAQPSGPVRPLPIETGGKPQAQAPAQG